MKQITQSDLQVFPNLAYFESYANDIKELEQGLFDSNPKMKYIYFGYDEIKKIYPSVFSNLHDLIYLNLQSNICIDSEANNNAEVQDVIRQIKLQCKSSMEYVECPSSCLSQIARINQDQSGPIFIKNNMFNMLVHQNNKK